MLVVSATGSTKVLLLTSPPVPEMVILWKTCSPTQSSAHFRGSAEHTTCDKAPVVLRSCCICVYLSICRLSFSIANLTTTITTSLLIVMRRWVREADEDTPPESIVGAVQDDDDDAPSSQPAPEPAPVRVVCVMRECGRGS